MELSLVRLCMLLFLQASTSSHSSQLYLKISNSLSIFFSFARFAIFSPGGVCRMSYVYFYYVLHFFHETWIFVSSPESFSLDASISRKECLFLTWLSLMGSSRRLQSSIIIYSLTRFVFCMSKILVCLSPIRAHFKSTFSRGVNITMFLFLCAYILCSGLSLFVPSWKYSFDQLWCPSELYFINIKISYLACSSWKYHLSCTHAQIVYLSIFKFPIYQYSNFLFVMLKFPKLRRPLLPSVMISWQLESFVVECWYI